MFNIDAIVLKTKSINGSCHASWHVFQYSLKYIKEKFRQDNPGPLCLMIIWYLFIANKVPFVASAENVIGEKMTII